MSLFKSFEKQVVMDNGKHFNATIEISVEEDPEIDFKSTTRKFMAVVIVKATALGELGADSIACTIHCNNMFNSEPFMLDVESTLADNDMIHAAIDDLKVNIIKRANLLKPYATK